MKKKAIDNMNKEKTVFYFFIFFPKVGEVKVEVEGEPESWRENNSNKGYTATVSEKMCCA